MSVEYYNIFEIKEYGSCYELVKIVDSEYNLTIWFNDVFPNRNMLSKSKAYEIIKEIKNHLELNTQRENEIDKTNNDSYNQNTNKLIELKEKVDKLTITTNAIYNELQRVIKVNNNLYEELEKRVATLEDGEDDDFEALDLSPVKELLEKNKKEDKNEQSIQDIQKRILLKHFIKNWYTDEIDYCDSSTKKCTQNSCLDHYLEYYMENKLWDKIV